MLQFETPKPNVATIGQYRYKASRSECQKNIDIFKTIRQDDAILWRFHLKCRHHTVVHHRETPFGILKKTVDVGPVWATEVIHAKSSGLAFEVIEPGEDFDQRDRINYYICKLKDAPNPGNAKKFIEFIRSPGPQKIYQKYGFLPYQ